jgi:DNA invertase Pin-like site-specific DNA recombinase
MGGSRPLRTLAVYAAMSRIRRNWTGRCCQPTGAGDQLVVTKLDRLDRSLEHLIELSRLLQARGRHH